MELLLFRRFEFDKLYLNKCSRIYVDHFPLEQRIWPINGTILILIFLISEIFYIPCMFAIWKHVPDNSCYKFLFYIGITDMLIMWICGFFSGYFALNGAVFCTNPILIYVLGSFAMGLWFAESITDFLLAIDRCLEMSFPRIAERIFGGHRACIWMFAITIYSIYWFFYTNPIIFSSVYCSWFFNPFVGYHEDTENLYTNYLHFVHNTFLGITFPVIYALFGLRVVYLSRKASTTNVEQNVAKKLMFIQVGIISAFNCSDCLLFLAMQYIDASEAHILFAQYAWFSIHGIPPFIYLAFNRTIRNDCRKMIGSLFSRMSNALSKVGIFQQIHPAPQNNGIKMDRIVIKEIRI